MKNLKLKAILSNFLVVMLVIIFLTSCEQENIIVPSQELNVSSTEPVTDGQVLEKMYNNNALVSEPDRTIVSPVAQNEIEVLIKDASYSSGDTHTINVYCRDILHSATPTNSLRTMIDVPTIWRNNMKVEIEKYIENTKSIHKGGLSVIIAAEVREPG